MKKSAIIGLIIAFIALTALTVVLVLYFKGGDLEKAIDRYESGDHVGSLRLLNKLEKTAGYDTGEKIYYYRCKAINALAESLEARYDDELRDVALENSRVSEREREKRYLEKKLANINGKTAGDLVLVQTGKGGKIVSKGRFYDEFVARYKGSRYIEDLDFEELQKIRRTERDKLLSAVANYHARYPGSIYVAPIVKMIFDVLKEGRVEVKGKEDFIKEIIIEYGRRYPTSSEIQRIFLCDGSDVNLRNSPGIEGSVVGKIARDEILIQIEKTMDTAQIGDRRDYWYRVVNVGGLRGWIFGKFLKPLDITPYMTESGKAAWSVEDSFREWSDSHTPSNWMQVPDADPRALSFTVAGDRRIVRISSPKGAMAGLFRRFASGGAFGLCARARYIAGDSFVVYARVMNGGRSYYLRLGAEEIELSGRKIPLRTADWHEYLLESEDGTSARLIIDGDLVLSRIPPAVESAFTEQGIYCLYSGEGDTSSGEIEYIKIR